MPPRRGLYPPASAPAVGNSGGPALQGAAQRGGAAAQNGGPCPDPSLGAAVCTAPAPPPRLPPSEAQPRPPMQPQPHLQQGGWGQPRALAGPSHAGWGGSNGPYGAHPAPAAPAYCQAPWGHAAHSAGYQPGYAHGGAPQGHHAWAGYVQQGPYAGAGGGPYRGTFGQAAPSVPGWAPAAPARMGPTWQPRPLPPPQQAPRAPPQPPKRKQSLVPEQPPAPKRTQLSPSEPPPPPLPQQPQTQEQNGWTHELARPALHEAQNAQGVAARGGGGGHGAGADGRGGPPGLQVEESSGRGKPGSSAAMTLPQDVNSAALLELQQYLGAVGAPAPAVSELGVSRNPNSSCARTNAPPLPPPPSTSAEDGVLGASPSASASRASDSSAARLSSSGGGTSGRTACGASGGADGESVGCEQARGSNSTGTRKAAAEQSGDAVGREAGSAVTRPPPSLAVPGTGADGGLMEREEDDDEDAEKVVVDRGGAAVGDALGDAGGALPPPPPSPPVLGVGADGVSVGGAQSLAAHGAVEARAEGSAHASGSTNREACGAVPAPPQPPARPPPAYQAGMLRETSLAAPQAPPRPPPPPPPAGQALLGRVVEGTVAGSGGDRERRDMPAANKPPCPPAPAHEWGPSAAFPPPPLQPNTPNGQAAGMPPAARPEAVASAESPGEPPGAKSGSPGAPSSPIGAEAVPAQAASDLSPDALTGDMADSSATPMQPLDCKVVGLGTCARMAAEEGAAGLAPAEPSAIGCVGTARAGAAGVELPQAQRAPAREAANGVAGAPTGTAAGTQVAADGAHPASLAPAAAEPGFEVKSRQSQPQLAPANYAVLAGAQQPAPSPVCKNRADVPGVQPQAAVQGQRAPALQETQPLPEQRPRQAAVTEVLQLAVVHGEQAPIQQRTGPAASLLDGAAHSLLPVSAPAGLRAIALAPAQDDQGARLLKQRRLSAGHAAQEVRFMVMPSGENASQVHMWRLVLEPFIDLCHDYVVGFVGSLGALYLPSVRGVLINARLHFSPCCQFSPEHLPWQLEPLCARLILK